MGSLPTESFSVEDEHSDNEKSKSRMARTQWLLNSPNPPSLFHELLSSIKETLSPPSRLCRSRSAVSVLQGLFPILSWAGNYKASKFKDDLMAGLTLASLSIPQSIGYASLAKLDPQYDTSVVPPMIYALMGSSREIAIGPGSCGFDATFLHDSETRGPHNQSHCLQEACFHCHFLCRSLPSCVWLIQVGLSCGFFLTCRHCWIYGRCSHCNWPSTTQGASWDCSFHYQNRHNLCIGGMVSFEFYPWLLVLHLHPNCKGRRNKKLFWLPAIAPLISVILSTLIVYLTKADKHGVQIVKHFKGGLNPISAHQLQLRSPHVGQAAKIGLICAIVALTEAIAVGRSFASIKGYHIDGNKEMVAMGFMNIAGSLTSCYLATGSFSRTAVNFSAGCQTVVSNIVMAITVLISLELLTRLLYFTPIAILASIILSALPGLININEAYNIWKVDKLDFLACIGAFFGVLFASVEIGLLTAVTISFAKIILNSIRPRTEVLGRLPETDIFCDIKQYPAAIRTPGFLIIRFNTGLLCFANANFIRERIMRWVIEEDRTEEISSGKIHIVVLDMSNVMNIDTSGILALEELHKELVARGIELAVANPRWQVIDKLKVAKFVDKIGKGRIFLTVSEAVDAWFESKMVGSYSYV
ncbi:hypothetical protein HYC85_008056 [Camellia sinensis]|uniref:STAS domain-containing protein n=1 Tax=Camellia sinensis TaxID=4442 RepID=A0A7J7HQR8_CAMSI|nr:hypothetical protein HYC85_008056 [Camellia sinensis]